MDVRVTCTRVIQIPALRIPWSDQAGGPILELTTDEPQPSTPPSRWHTDRRGTIISPPTDGRWDMNRTTTFLNQGKLTIFIYALNDPLNANKSITRDQARCLAATFARISARIPAHGERDWQTCTAYIEGRWDSLALRHQPHILGDPVDPWEYWRNISWDLLPLPQQLSPTVPLAPPCINFTEYTPLTRLRHITFPDGKSPTCLQEYFQDECYSQSPCEDAAIFSALRLKAIMEVEQLRYNTISALAEQVGSLAHISPTQVDTPTHPCEMCQGLRTSLYAVRRQYCHLARTFEPPAALALLQTIATIRADGNPASRGASTYAASMRQRILDYTTPSYKTPSHYLP